MAETLSMGTMFDPDLVSELFSTVRGKSSIAALCAQDPISFTGNKYMVFSMDKGVQIVGENEQKQSGDMDITPVVVNPIKIQWGHRVSDEFMNVSQEKDLEILAAFNDGFAKKVAEGLDEMAFHGIDPFTETTSSQIAKSFADISNVVAYDESAPDDCLQKAILALGDYDCTGMALSKNMAAAMGSMRAGDTVKTLLYPEFAFGAQATSFYGTPCSVNKTVSWDGDTQAILGDFSAFRWGFAAEIPLEVIPYGDPDQTGIDLKAHNQVYLRAEAYIGFGILVDDAFCKVSSGASPTKLNTKKAE